MGKSALLHDIDEYLSSIEGLHTVAGSAGDMKAARHLADKVRSVADRVGPEAHVVLLVDDLGRLRPAERGILLDFRKTYPAIRVIATARYDGQLDGVIPLRVPTLSGSGNVLASDGDLSASSEVSQFFVHCLQSHNPTAQVTRADVGSLARICANSFGIPAEVDALAELADRYGLAAVADAVSEDGSHQRLGELLEEANLDRLTSPGDAPLSADEMVVLASVMTAKGGASIPMLQQSLPRCDILGLTRSLVARGLVHSSEGNTSGGVEGPPHRFHLRVTGVPTASWCATQPEISLSAIRQAQADYLSSRVRRMAARVSSPEQADILAEFRDEQRNLKSSLLELTHAERFDQAVALMWDALPLLARTYEITELLPYVLHVIREYAPTGADHQRSLYKLAVYVLAAAGEHESATVYFEKLVEILAIGSERDSDPDLPLLGVLVAECSTTEEAADAMLVCVKEDADRQDLVRLCESATAYFSHLVQSRDFARLEAECRALLFESTRSGDDYASGLFLLWRAAAAGGTRADTNRLYVERALAKLRPLGPAAAISAISRVVDNRHVRDLRQGGTQLAMVVGALGQEDWPWLHGSTTAVPVLVEITLRLTQRIGTKTAERWAEIGGTTGLVDLLCQILPGKSTDPVRAGEPDPASTVRTQRSSASVAQLIDRSGLTPREAEVANLVATGLTNKQIGKRLGISEWTAINHLRQIMRKLDCSSRVQVANQVHEIDAELERGSAHPVSGEHAQDGGPVDVVVPRQRRDQARTIYAKSEVAGSN
ncbi:LuxR C-terminal-related transcriptional regulator [Streptomyces sp. 900105755]